MGQNRMGYLPLSVCQRFHVVKVLSGLLDDIRNERQSTVAVIETAFVQNGLHLGKSSQHSKRPDAAVSALNGIEFVLSCPGTRGSTAAIGLQ